jgi:hypothetical protein
VIVLDTFLALIADKEGILRMHFDVAIPLNYLHPPFLCVPFVIRFVRVHRLEAKNQHRTDEEFAEFSIRARALRSSCCRTQMALIGNSG